MWSWEHLSLVPLHVSVILKDTSKRHLHFIEVQCGWHREQSILETAIPAACVWQKVAEGCEGFLWAFFVLGGSRYHSQSNHLELLNDSSRTGNGTKERSDYLPCSSHQTYLVGGENIQRPFFSYLEIHSKILSTTVTYCAMALCLLTCPSPSLLLSTLLKNCSQQPMYGIIPNAH